MLEEIAANRCFGGWHRRYRHRSQVLRCEMVFAVYLPPQVTSGSVPALYWLSGLTCSDENFMQKAGAMRAAAELGIALIAPDTSPRGPGVPGDPDGAWDFGHGAGFYLNATQAPWAEHYRMHDYVVHELPELVEANLPVNACRGISGHSMGGHGALVCALRNPGRYRSLSAFAPISHALASPWGQKAFARYLGEDRVAWRAWDVCELIAGAEERLPLLVDQGEADVFFSTQLQPEKLRQACVAAGHPLRLRLHPGYDHSYYFIASFIDDHLHHHAAALIG
ncbi:MAG: S-formylglutathione hydrolase [Candidatus Accumulibacter phosphatis]|uniref:S-formylglutathione hydrolase n=2 Tax=Candidatus Accumulibacter TaxID=327159 RepID=A0A080LXI1_9PROT|nr:MULTISPECIES: S-formylglutathione hydrolase [Candidatus Accumulibacter]KFB73552.1 MAG: S-formylglutathione hydrolase YeiG [Candidatus Accumulibacter phosphatis]MBL8408445.1 S-formylglutathione hydrolase [Accumulibacter sp.]NMQ05378.1 S-formylglutathione hydrolase [Candidatus Accumulibacter contiguus]HRF11264.1 S-formylglutathione hydrolase [Candidatus Accumulibacter phosphatis]